MKRIAALVFLAFMAVPAVSLETQVYYGEPVIVTALKRPLLMSKVLESVSVIDSTEIKMSGAKNAADVLRSRAAVYVKSAGGLSGISSVKIKSASTEQVLVLIDGVRLNSTLLGMSDLNNIPASSIERIEIISDPMSGIWGADAMGGVINIITNRSQDRPLQALFNWGSFGQSDGRIGFKGRMGAADYYLSLGGLRSDGYRVNSDFSSQDLALEINADKAASINYSISGSSRGNPGVPSSDNDPSSSSTPNDRQSDLISKLLVSLDPGKGQEGYPKLNISQIEWVEKTHYADWFNPSFFYDDTYLSKISQAELSSTIKAGANTKLTGGLEFKRNLGQSPKAQVHTVDNAAIYFNGQTGENLPAGITYMLRYDSNSAFGSVLTPKIGCVFNYDKNTSVRLNLATAFRAPTINELYWDDPAFLTFGNPNLKPETSNSAGITIEKKAFGIDASLNYYYTRINDMIKWSQTGPLSWQPVNLDKTRIEGVQLNIKKELFKGLELTSGWNNELCVDEGTQKTLTYSPKNKLNVALSYSSGDTSGRISYRYVSDVFTNAADSAFIPAYQTVDLGLSKKIRGISFTLSLLNLFNENYCESVGTSPVDWKERGYPMPGRTISVGIEI